MEIKSEITDKIVWIKVSGRMILDPSLLRLREQVLFGIESGIKKFVIDFSEVSQLDSLGCGEVISAHTTIQRAKGLLIFVNPSEYVRALWSHTKLDTVLTILDTLDEARAFVRK